jgi:hypothetical protein
VLKSSNLLLLVGCLLAAVFIVAIAHLFQLRYASGDVYPPYSSLRSDPLGTKALFQSLSRLRGLHVARNLRPLETLADDRSATILFLGLDARETSHPDPDVVHEWERLLRPGQRLVLSFAPVSQRPERPRFFGQAPVSPKPAEQRPARPPKDGRTREEARPDTTPRESGKRGPFTPPPETGRSTVSLEQRWAMGFAYEDLPKDADGRPEPVAAHPIAGANLPSSISWRTALYFESLGPAWRVVYKRGQHPVLIERKLGGGTLMLTADSYFLSNEAMRQDCYPELLGWVIGSPARVIFDETHLGLSDTPSLATLARKYRLHGAAAALLLLAGLFVWKCCYSLVPSQANAASSRELGGVAGKDASLGLVSLLRRSISSPEVLFSCFEEWKSAGVLRSGRAAARLPRMESIVAEQKALSPNKRRPVESYRRLSQILAEKS